MASKELFIDLRSLPILAAENIACHLNGQDLINLGLTCTFWHEVAQNNSLWKVLVQRRFREQQQDEAEINFKELYLKLARNKMAVSAFPYILHLNGNYLEKIQDPESTFGTVIHLKTVCWLQLNGVFRGVLPGKYRCMWRMKLSNAYMNCTDSEYIYFKAKPAENCGAELSCQWNEGRVRREEREHGTNKWFIVDMGEVWIESMCDVCVEIHGRIGWWCGGFFWDYVELKPVKTLSNPPRKKGNVESRRKGNLQSGCLIS